ncbi:MAG: DUF4123 domain-containing protein, partial [Chania sp.]
MDITVLLQAIPETDDCHLYLLIEGGAQTAEGFQAFYTAHSSAMSSLFLHPQLTDARTYGPWLFALEKKEQLGEYLKNTPGIVGVIVSPRLPGSLAIQLSNACTIICPDKSTALIRFYSRHVLNTLVQCHEQEWHYFLFKDIAQWWTPIEGNWQPVTLVPSTAENARERTVRLNEEIWQQIADKPEVSTVLAQWQKMPASQHFPPCAQRDMVIKALDKAQAAGLDAGPDRKLYALYYLNGGK